MDATTQRMAARRAEGSPRGTPAPAPAPLAGGSLAARARRTAWTGLAAGAAAGTLLLLLLPWRAGAAGAAAALAGAAAAAAVTTLVGLRALRRCALGPVTQLREAAERISRGDVETRVALPAGADPELAAVAAALNRLLDAMAGDRRRLRDVAARAFRAQETERTRLAHELQEQTAQTLAGILFQLRAARVTQDAAGRNALLDDVRARLSETTDTVRRFARGLRPPALDDVGVVAAIEAYAQSLEGAGPAIHVRADDVRGLLARDGEVALYRVVQEALANAVRHARARAVGVDVTRAGDRVRVAVQDDGRGFDVAETEAAHPCLGLFGMRERALWAGGTATVESRPGRGTRVVVELPVARPEEGGTWPVILPRG